MDKDIFEILLAPWKIGVITTAIRLNIFTILSGRELTLDEVASRCSADPDRLKALLGACINLGFLEHKNDKYKNSSFSSTYFIEGKRLYVGDFIQLVYMESLEWFQLPDLICGVKKKTIKLPELPSDYRTFITAMNCIANLGEATAFTNVVDLSGCRRMTDAGGGSGSYSVALCQKYPELHSTILDVGETLEVTRELIADRPERQRITLLEGDFYKDPLGENLDAVLLSDVMYGESDAGTLLQNAWDSLKPHGVLIVRGYYAHPEGSGPLFGALFAVKLLVDDPQRKIMTISMLEKNVKQIGFRNVEVKQLTERSYVLLANK